MPLWHEAFTPRRAALLVDIWGRGQVFGLGKAVWRPMGLPEPSAAEAIARPGHETCSSLTSQVCPGPTSAPERGKGKGNGFSIMLRRLAGKLGIELVEPPCFRDALAEELFVGLKCSEQHAPRRRESAGCVALRTLPQLGSRE